MMSESDLIVTLAYMLGFRKGYTTCFADCTEENLSESDELVESSLACELNRQETSIEDIAKLLEVDENTVRSWVKGETVSHSATMSDKAAC